MSIVLRPFPKDEGIQVQDNYKRKDSDSLKERIFLAVSLALCLIGFATICWGGLPLIAGVCMLAVGVIGMTIFFHRHIHMPD